MQHERHGESRLQLCQTLEVDARLALVGAVHRADRDGQGVYARGFHQLLRRIDFGILDTRKRMGGLGVLGAHVSDLGLHVHAVRVRQLNDLLGTADVLGQLFVRGVDHHGREAKADRLLDDVHALAVVEVQRHRNRGLSRVERSQRRRFVEGHLVEMDLREA